MWLLIYYSRQSFTERQTFQRLPPWTSPAAPIEKTKQCVLLTTTRQHHLHIAWAVSQSRKGDINLLRIRSWLKKGEINENSKVRILRGRIQRIWGENWLLMLSAKALMGFCWTSRGTVLEKYSHTNEDSEIGKLCECRQRGAVSVLSVQAERGADCFGSHT